MAKRRAQAAMEFLMTYGWAILVVLIVIGALAYFGVLNPDRLLPEKCTVMVGLYCNDHIVSNTAVTLKLENGMGRDVSIVRIFLNETSVTPLASGVNASYVNISNGQQLDIVIPWGGTPTMTVGNKYKFNIEFVYHYDDVNFQHTGRGELFASIE